MTFLHNTFNVHFVSWSRGCLPSRRSLNSWMRCLSWRMTHLLPKMCYLWHILWSCLGPSSPRAPHLLKCVSTLLQLRYHEWDVAFEEEVPLSEGFPPVIAPVLCSLQLQLFHPLLLSSLSSQKGRELREKVRGEECLASQMFVLLSSLQGYALLSLLQQPTIAQSIREALPSLYLERRDEYSCPVYCS